MQFYLFLFDFMERRIVLIYITGTHGKLIEVSQTVEALMTGPRKRLLSVVFISKN